MRRIVLSLSLACLLVCGCGKVKPQQFTASARPLAEQMGREIDAKNMAEIDRIVATAEQRLGKFVSKSEFDVLLGAQTFAKKDEWDKAKKLMSESLSMK